MLEAEKSRLYLHRIPCSVPYEELNGVISRDFPHKVKPTKRQEGQYYSAIVVFNSPEEANQAFENIAGELGKDSTGLPQKQVFLQPSPCSGPRLYFYVRKMVEDDSVGEVSVEEKNVSCKKRKRGYDSGKTREKRRSKSSGRKKTEKPCEAKIVSRKIKNSKLSDKRITTSKGPEQWL